MTPMNHRTKFDTASFILSGEILNRTKTNDKKQAVLSIYPRIAYRHVWIKNVAAVFYKVTGCSGILITELSRN